MSPVIAKRRRTVAIIFGLIVVIVVGLIIASAVAGSGPETSEKVELPDDVANGEAELDTSGNEACAKEDLTVKAHTDALTYPGGEEPKFSLSIENSGKSECVADLGTKNMVFSVTDGSDEIWTSTDCQEDGDSREVILEPKKPLATDPISWDRTYSDPETCGHADRNLAETGEIAYELHVSITGVKSKEPALFMLED